MTGLIKGLYAIVDSNVGAGFKPAPTEISPVQLAKEYAEGGARIIQWRDKRRHQSPSDFSRFVEVAHQIARLRDAYKFLFIVNDEVKIAQEVNADGVHVGKDDLSIEKCREILGPEKIIGYSSHSLEEAIAAEKRGADYVAFGAIFPSPTKGPGHPVQGLERLREVVMSLHVPVVAIGGITRENIRSVKETGVSAIAMISALAKADNRIESTLDMVSLSNHQPTRGSTSSPCP